MSIDGVNYHVQIEDYAKSHYIKDFKKKYKKAWAVTEDAVISLLTRIDQVVKKTSLTDTIITNGDESIVKLDFTVAGTKKSAKGSGNRAIVYVNRYSLECRILLVYSKNHISPPNETQKWKEIIKKNYSSIWRLFEQSV